MAIEHIFIWITLSNIISYERPEFKLQPSCEQKVDEDDKIKKINSIFENAKSCDEDIFLEILETSICLKEKAPRIAHNPFSRLPNWDIALSNFITPNFSPLMKKWTNNKCYLRFFDFMISLGYYNSNKVVQKKYIKCEDRPRILKYGMELYREACLGK
jgi:hypothetical protein